MSEAMSSADIEDVLASIRRLVSEDLRPAPRAAAAPMADDKLLLTPALRVVSDRDRPVEPARAAPLPRLHLGTAAMADDPVGTLERAVEAQEIEFESEVGDPAPLVSRLEWTEDGWAPIVDSIAAAEVDPWSQTEADHSADDAAALADDGEPIAYDGELPADDAEPLVADVEPAPPIALADDDWADRAEAEVVAELREGQHRVAQQTVSAEPLLDELTFDEQVLRDVVRDLIREELQGALGERITRNVRKLVRAEIARAIATQDLE